MEIGGRKMGRNEKRSAAQRKRIALRQGFEREMVAALDEMPGPSIEVAELWSNFFRRLDQRKIANDQMALQELLLYKRDFETEMRSVLASIKQDS
jgi:hypothetical protein